jgi:hypothetical protein
LMLIPINCRPGPLLSLPLHPGNFLFWLDCTQTAVLLRVMEGFQWNKSIQFTIGCNEYTIRCLGDVTEVEICRIESVCRLQSKWCKHYFQCYSTWQPWSKFLFMTAFCIVLTRMILR